VAGEKGGVGGGDNMNKGRERHRAEGRGEERVKSREKEGGPVLQRGRRWVEEWEGETGSR